MILIHVNQKPQHLLSFPADPFEQDFPEVIEDTLEAGQAVTVKFNRRGTLLAAGCSDGTIVVWDFDTRGVSRSLVGHVKTVTSLR